MYNWETIKKYIEVNEGYKLTRTNESREEYNKFIDSLKKYKSIKDYIYITYLKSESIIENNKICSIKKGMKKYNLCKNIYPYNVESNIKHYILWSIEDLEEKDDKINKIIKKFKGNCDYLYFYNPKGKRSISDVFHIHVFFK